MFKRSCFLAASIAGLASLIGTGCSYGSPDAPEAPEPARPFARRQGIPGYNTLRAQIFVPKCIRCHGERGGVNLETYATAANALDKIKNSVLREKSMPPSGPLASDQLERVQAWIDAGAPENDLSP